MDGLIRRNETAIPMFPATSAEEQQTNEKREHRLRIAVTALAAINLFFLCGVATVTALAFGLVP